jgi:hypothetical protein
MSMSIDDTLGPPEDIGESPIESTDGAKQGTFNRRTFLKAAALGTAAAALLNKDALGNLELGPMSALADDLTSLGCTAKDVQLLNNGVGQITNESCNCTPGTSFIATALFTVTNNASSRFCVQLHLCPKTVTIPGTTQTAVIGASPILLGGGETINAKSTLTAPGTFLWYCGLGLQTFGSGVTFGNSGNPTCSGSCCNVITWSVPGQDGCPPTKNGVVTYIKSKCGMQAISIQGRFANMTCVAGCSPTCGGTSTLTAAAGGGTSTPVFTLSGGSQSATVTGSPATFTVSTTATTTYTVVANTGDCLSTLTQVIGATTIGPPALSGNSTADCNGSATITATLTDATSFVFSEGTNTTTLIGSSASLGFAFAVPTCTAGATATTHTVSVTAYNAAGCPNSASTPVTVNPKLCVGFGPVSTPTACVAASASSLAFTASASGGSGAYAFTWSLDGTSVASGATYAYGENLDALCHTVLVTATDQQTCTATATLAQTVSQCVQTSFGCKT